MTPREPVPNRSSPHPGNSASPTRPKRRSWARPRIKRLRNAMRRFRAWIARGRDLQVALHKFFTVPRARGDVRVKQNGVRDLRNETVLTSSGGWCYTRRAMHRSIPIPCSGLRRRGSAACGCCVQHAGIVVRTVVRGCDIRGRPDRCTRWVRR